MEDGVRGLRSIPYQRPNQQWICGHHAEGRPCVIGPDQHGRCVATSECRPIKRGDRWECTRPAAAGGPCADGPGAHGSCALPIERCVPMRSLAARRSLLIRWALLLTVAALALGLSTRWRNAFLLPGDLSSGHAMLISQGAAGCAACHGEALAISTARAARPAAQTDTDRCVACHAPVVGRPFARQPHTTSPEGLALATSRRQRAARAARSWSLALAAAAPLGAKAGDIACATCHHEHRGATHRLTAMGDGRCQSCHTAPFSSFTSGHPEFSERRIATAVGFDHTAHRSTHFGSTPFACASCHVPDGTGRRMATVPFEQACTNCHHQDSRDHHRDQIRAPRLLALQLPEMVLDGPVLWPAEAAVGESVTPLIRLLLAGEADGPGLDAVQALYQDEDAGGVPLDWVGSAEQKTALAGAIETVVRELAAGNDQALRARLARALAAPADDLAVNRLSEHLASARLAALTFERRWIRGTAPEGKDTEAPADGGPPPPVARGWSLDVAASAAIYRPVSHADPVFHALADALAAHADGAKDDRGAVDAASFRRAARTQVFADLTSRQAGGPLYAACLRCHQVVPSGDAFRVRWQSVAPTAPLARLTWFNHASHTAAANEAATCGSCHVLGKGTPSETPGGPAQSAAGASPPMGVQPIRKAQCVTCHTPGVAPSGCLTCHQYHAAASSHSSGSSVTDRAASRVAITEQ